MSATQARLRTLALTSVALLACSEPLNCSDVGCVRSVRVSGVEDYPPGASAELCGANDCVMVRLDGSSIEGEGTFTVEPVTLDRRRFRPDVWRSITTVRILSGSGAVLAEGEGEVSQEADSCCATTFVSFHRS